MRTDYPSMAEIDGANIDQLIAWYKTLPSPGINAWNKHRDEIDLWRADMRQECLLYRAIVDRLIAWLAREGRELNDIKAAAVGCFRAQGSLRGRDASKGLPEKG